MLSTESEIWKPVVGWEDVYSVSNFGRVRSEERRDRLGRLVRQKFLRLIDDGRYFGVKLCNDGEVTSVRVHTLVATAFKGPRPTPKHEVLHDNDDGHDNREDNIRWGTSKQNSDDQQRNKGFQRELKHHSGVLSNAQVAEIRLLRHGEIGQWADRNGVSRGHVYSIRSGWRR